MLLVLQADRGDQREDRLADVRGVQPASHPDLDHRQIDLLSREREEGGGGDGLEVGRLLRRRPYDPVQIGSEVFLGDAAAVDPDALADGFQVRRGVEAHLPAGGPGHGGEEGRGRALAVAAGHEDRAKPELRIAQVGAETAEAVQAEPHAQPFEAREDLFRAVQGW
jgi:hypothetical protein